MGGLMKEIDMDENGLVSFEEMVDWTVSDFSDPGVKETLKETFKESFDKADASLWWRTEAVGLHKGPSREVVALPVAARRGARRTSRSGGAPWPERGAGEGLHNLLLFPLPQNRSQPLRASPAAHARQVCVCVARLPGLGRSEWIRTGSAGGAVQPGSQGAMGAAEARSTDGPVLRAGAHAQAFREAAVVHSGGLLL